MKRMLLVMMVIISPSCGKEQPRLAGTKWSETLRDPNPKLRKKAAFTLGNIGPSDPAVLPALIGALKDADPEVRCEAILGLLKWASEAKAAIPNLIELQEKDQDAKVRNYAAKALEKLKKVM